MERWAATEMVSILYSGSIPDVPCCYPRGAKISYNAQHGTVGCWNGVSETIAYRFLHIFPPDQFEFKIFWVDSDEHVRALFDLHRRHETREVMEVLTEMQRIPDVAGGSSSSNGVIPCSPIHCPAPEVPMLMDTNSGEDSDID
ncbi:hypothetical protein PIB30_000624 [Stylosanthes scabra]|uniref:Uncharacterized protein n=1 Tax=Stylosanthes scabra TaxID=79078 RepID=A0ABU6Y0V1_9FABA|nr:hypothetical protein [Stylosanthes scabra]